MTMIIKTATRENETFRETGGVLVGIRKNGLIVARLRFKCTGEPHSVTFDWALALKQEESAANVVGFYHTHPPGMPGPSGRDDRTMRAWVTCFGKDLICVIESENSIEAWEYSKDGKREIGPPSNFKKGWIRVQS